MRVWGLSVGLASDVAGGPELNPWEVMKAAAYGHRARSCFVPETLIPSQVELFHLGATEAARVLEQEKTLGQLKSGYSADLVVWDVSILMPYRQNLLDLKDPNLILSRLMYRGALARAVKVWVAGKPV